jgi:SAM-dependent methyltransferase
MYGGLDKAGGSVIGQFVTDGQETVLAGDAAMTASAEEILMGIDGNKQQCALAAIVDCNSGELKWVPVDAAAATQRAIAMGQMSSMLTDADRNAAYEKAITEAVHAFIALHGRAPLVLDIGCGTGLLSMMAIRAGAEHVHACEMFTAMADIAKAVTGLNCPGKVTVHAIRSTELRCADAYAEAGLTSKEPESKKSLQSQADVLSTQSGTGLMPRRADILVNEVCNVILMFADSANVANCTQRHTLCTLCVLNAFTCRYMTLLYLVKQQYQLLETHWTGW